MADNELDAIRAAAARYPEAERAFLFGDHEVYRVKKKVFLWLDGDEGVGVGVKLKQTQDMALSLPFAEPMAYGMAKYGWISASFPRGKAPLSLIFQWLDESYRGTAPKKLVAQLEAAAAPSKERPAANPKAKTKPKAKARTGTRKR